jgi:hypothetical protein
MQSSLRPEARITAEDIAANEEFAHRFRSPLMNAMLQANTDNSEAQNGHVRRGGAVRSGHICPVCGASSVLGPTRSPR